MEESYLQWINTFTLPVQPQSLGSLSNGQIISKILSLLIPEWFKHLKIPAPPSSNNYVLDFNNLKKITKFINSYFKDELAKDHSAYINTIDLTAIAKSADTTELIKLCNVILLVAVTCQDKERYIKNITTLPKTSQESLMHIIKSQMSLLDTNSENIPPPQKESTESLLKRNTLLQSQNAQLKSKLEEMQTAIEQGHSDSMLRNELKQMKKELSGKEDQVIQLQGEIMEKGAEVEDLSRKLKETLKKAKEASKLSDQLDEFRHMGDALQKSDAMIEKYKKKLEDIGGLRRTIKALEQQQQTNLSQIQSLEQELANSQSVTPKLESLKHQVDELTHMNSVLSKDNIHLKFEVDTTKEKLNVLEQERNALVEEVSGLEGKVQEFELQGGGGRMEGESLAGEMGEDSVGVLRQKIIAQQQQIDKLSVPSDQQQKIKELLEKLSETEALKNKFEDDYLKLYQSNMGLEYELSQLKQSGGGDDDSDLKIQLSTQQRISTAKLHKATQENTNLTNTIQELRTELEGLSRENSELQAMVSVHELNGKQGEVQGECGLLAKATEKVVYFQTQNDALHKALKQAKERIQSLQSLPTSPQSQTQSTFKEALLSFNTTLRERDAEIEKLQKECKFVRHAANRELRLMSGVWYGMLNGVAKNKIKEDGKDGKGWRDGNSWLGMQRRGLGVVGRF